MAAFQDSTSLDNMRQLIQLRWLAVFGQIVTIAVVYFVFKMDLPLVQMSSVLVCLAAFNVVSTLRWRTQREVTNAELFVALMVDVGILTAQLYLSGGATNPFVFLYLLQITLGAVLLEAWTTWIMVAITGICFSMLAVFSTPLELTVDRQPGLVSLYMQGMLICFALNAALLVIFITRIQKNLRTRDARLALLRQRAAEEEHIVRMGLLATGAAHELGTPMSTMSVILGDWRRMKQFTSEPELLHEIEEMQAQLQRCKGIVTGILLSAGEARGESPVETTMRTFLDDLVARWRATRPRTMFIYDNRFAGDIKIVSDSALAQMICNVLDNALEASPEWVSFEAAREGEHLVMKVTDKGPGFREDILEQFGKPYRSTKGRAGGGLGLFLVANVARTLGGDVSARNRLQIDEDAGAEVTMRLPLVALRLDKEHARGR